MTSWRNASTVGNSSVKRITRNTWRGNGVMLGWLKKKEGSGENGEKAHHNRFLNDHSPGIVY
jgi:hypothetical protein